MSGNWSSCGELAVSVSWLGVYQKQFRHFSFLTPVWGWAQWRAANITEMVVVVVIVREGPKLQFVLCLLWVQLWSGSSQAAHKGANLINFHKFLAFICRNVGLKCFASFVFCVIRCEISKSYTFLRQPRFNFGASEEFSTTRLQYLKWRIKWRLRGERKNSVKSKIIKFYYLWNSFLSFFINSYARTKLYYRFFEKEIGKQVLPLKFLGPYHWSLNM